MQTIQASEFKARCLALMDQVAASGEILVITKNGKPVAELHPYQGARASSPFGLHPGVLILGDTISPRMSTPRCRPKGADARAP